MKTDSCDILVVGGGIAGLIASSAVARAGYKTICIEPRVPITQGHDPEADTRTTAFLTKSLDILERAGLGPEFTQSGTPLQKMRIADISKAPTVTREFDSADIDQPYFGLNFPNWHIRAKALDALEACHNAQFITGAALTDLTLRQDAAVARLSNGATVQAKLIIGADGRHSAVARLTKIAMRPYEFGQSALTFAVTHDIPHENISTEIHRSGGPFTLVPLPDLDNRPRSAVVWMDDHAATHARKDLNVSEFEQQATDRSGHLFGPLTLCSSRQTWPILSQLAQSLSARRVALIAEAAHVMPPIGAQGLNTSLADVGAILDVLGTVSDPGDPAALRRYQNMRWPDMAARMAGVSALNHASQIGAPVLQQMRRFGLEMFHDVPLIRRGLMHLGLGAR